MHLSALEIRKFYRPRDWTNIHPMDREYDALTDTIVMELFAGFEKFRVAEGIDLYVPEINDCDDAGVQFWAYCRRTYPKLYPTGRPPAVGFFVMPGHALNVVFRPDGKRTFEPQLGVYVPKEPLALLVV